VIALRIATFNIRTAEPLADVVDPIG